MSRFLGPIHHWLFNKIKLHEALEVELIQAYTSKYGDEVNTIVEQAANKFGAPLPDAPLDQLIDTDNIHGWLQSRISIAETRQAAILTSAFQSYGQESIEMAMNLYKQQGVQSGTDAKSKGQVESAPAIYKALNNYILDGMPCDNVNNVTIAEPDHVEWKNIQCLHKGYWEAVGADIEVFYQLRAQWTKAFVENANEAFTYKVNTADFNGTTGFVHQILKK
ncbi:hypothetical protein HNQ80_005145 [Anaerosolibacter carboniphilus]|uniref:Uncharacterized protein n=1 Tax=Anaerosolibacter carboniphilus TaxID=1417629 RepID=A0A841L026_9FIRM|nr:hypothetical protein [Anaerosolibacter carboniphilus]MBB6218967.1 hypothetical protein [Anaerosolibacter carboniphilus]